MVKLFGKTNSEDFFFLREQEGFDSLLVIYQIKQKSLHQVRNKEGKKQKHYKLCLDILQCEADTSFESIVTSGDVSNHSQFFLNEPGRRAADYIRKKKQHPD